MGSCCRRLLATTSPSSFCRPPRLQPAAALTSRNKTKLMLGGSPISGEMKMDLNMVGMARRRQALGYASTHLGSSSEKAAEKLPDDLLIDIISRVPAKSLCRFKCVSKHWLSLIDHPEHRRKLPQTLVGFFWEGYLAAIQFTKVTGSSSPLIDTSFAFLPKYTRLKLLDCCDGLLLLCHWYTQGDEFRYVVCNPATEKWVMLPDSGQAASVGKTRLGFDRAVSSHFHVFVLLEDDHNDDTCITGMYIYSSETGRWNYKEKGWDRNIGLQVDESGAVFLNGYLHLYCYDYDLLRPCVAAVHMEGETWMYFDSPFLVDDGIIQQSQGQLHLAGFEKDEDDADEYDDDVDDADEYDDDVDDADDYDDDVDDADENVGRLVVYVLKDYGRKEWILKHSVETSYIGGVNDCIAIHPDCNNIFLSTGQVTCYNMNLRQTKVVYNVGRCYPPYLPYVPLYTELQSFHM